MEAAVRTVSVRPDRMAALRACYWVMSMFTAAVQPAAGPQDPTLATTLAGPELPLLRWASSTPTCSRMTAPQTQAPR